MALIYGFIVFLAAFWISLLLTRGLISWLPKWGLLDKPDFERHIHTVATPRGGGIGFVVAYVLVDLVFHLILTHTSDHILHFILKPLISLGILVPLGILDDRFGLPVGVKFLGQILAALLAWYLGCRMTAIFGIQLAPWASCIATIFWIVALINSFNMIDGVDGLAGGIGCISATSLAFVGLTLGYGHAVVTGAIFVGALLGFLRYNWHPAKIFMGDTGSMFIGFILATSSVHLNARTVSIVSIAVPLLACGVPVLDILLAVWRRIFVPETPAQTNPDTQPCDDLIPDIPESPMPQGVLRRCLHLLKRLGTADRHHLHHRLLKYFNNNQEKTVRRIYLLACVMGGLAVACAFIPGHNSLLSFLVLLGTFSFVINRLATVELWRSAESLYHNFHTPQTGAVLAHAINPIFDLFTITATIFFVIRNTPYYHPQVILHTVAVVMGVMMLSRNYHTFWNYSVADDYFRLIVTLLLGFCLAWCIQFLFPEFISTRHCLTSWAVATALILSQRLFVHYARNYLIRRRYLGKLDDDANITNTLLWGITPLARFYRDLLLSNIERAGQEQLLGILARQRRFRHSYVYGLKVLGTVKDLDELYNDTPFQKIVATLQPSPEELSRLQEFCRAHNITLTHFTATENSIRNA